MILQVGKIIHYLLSNNEQISKLVGKRIYPLIADSDTQFPFIIYKRTGIEILTSKDRYISKEEATVDIVIATDKYNLSVEIALMIKDALNNKRGNIADLSVRSINLIGADEDYIEDTFILKLTFKIEL